MKRLLFALALTIAALVVIPLASAQDNAYVVIVHADNPTTELSRTRLSDIFLKKATRWEDFPNPSRPDKMMTVAAVDLDSTSPVRDAFSMDIHGRSVDRIKAYWQRKIFSGRDVPPTELASQREMLAFVGGNRGAIGYVARSTALDGVKALTVTP